MGLTYTVCSAISVVVLKTLFRFRAYGSDNIPREGGCILAMNHESYLDPPLAGIAAPREIFYLARKTLLDWPIIGPLLPRLNVIPVDQDRADMSALKTVIKRVRAGECTVIFPEGSRTLDGDFLPALPGLGLVMAKTRCTVVPARVFGARAAFPRGGRPHLFRRITLAIEAPMQFTDADYEGEGRELYQRLSERVLGRIAEIKNPRD
ncbi:MAG: lysophospholipid acyltransferase family protein [Chthoniobacteraceae bacterium]